MSVYTTEITSETLPSENPVHQRLLYAYTAVQPFIHGDVLEVGCGEGRGIALLKTYCSSYTAIDKNEEIIEKLKAQYSDATFHAAFIPPFYGLKDNSFDVVISFQVIEHIQNDAYYLQEIARVLRPGGKAYLTTPNRLLSLSRNPWHTREYTPTELQALAAKYFGNVEMKGIFGSPRFMDYHEENRKSVQKIMQYDIFNLQYKLPGWLLRIPYEIANRRNRTSLQAGNQQLVQSISQDDFYLSTGGNSCLDLFLVAEK